MYLTQALHKGLIEQPDALAAVCGDEQRSHAELVDRVARLAGGLQSLGVAPGDRVAMMALNSIRYVEFFYGSWWAGAVVNPVNIRWSPREVAYSLDDCDTRVLIVDDVFAKAVPALREHSRSLQTVIFCGRGECPEGALRFEDLVSGHAPVPDAGRNGNDLAAVMYTGGTTGQSKGVMLGHQQLYLNALSNVSTLPRTQAGSVIAAPMFHVGAAGQLLMARARLMPTVIVPMFDEVALMTAIQTHRPDEGFLVPVMLKRLVDHPRFAEFDLSSLKLMLYGASPIDATLLDQAMRTLPSTDFVQFYGMTELSPTICALPAEAHRPGPHRERLLRAAGRPVPLAEVRIVDPLGRECPRGQVGEIVARGPNVMQGYWNKPEETAAAIRDGWMHTGDGGYMDPQGMVFVVDRVKDMIVSGGENVYSAEVENAILQLPQVAGCAVIGVPDDALGERVHAVVVLKPGAALNEDAIRTHCRDRIAGYKCPRSVEYRNELPLTAAGKLQKFLLREPHWAGRTRQVN
jgi:acyl-CoA synthetase (AMP-forming)/AMP-acid ligase II